MAAVRQRELMHHAERFNSLTHLAGAVLAVVGVTLLVVSASREGDPWKIVSFAVYGTTLSLLFIFSTLYHSLRGRAKSVFRRLDHLAIYLLIAGSYTPFALVTLYGAWGWSLFGVVWGLAIVGMALEYLPRRGPRILPVIVYLVMGWLALVAVKPLPATPPPVGVGWLGGRRGGCRVGPGAADPAGVRLPGHGLARARCAQAAARDAALDGVRLARRRRAVLQRRHRVFQPRRTAAGCPRGVAPVRVGRRHRPPFCRVLLRRLNRCTVTRAVRRSPFPRAGAVSGRGRYPWSLGAKESLNKKFSPQRRRERKVFSVDYPVLFFASFASLRQTILIRTPLACHQRPTVHPHLAGEFVLTGFVRRHRHHHRLAQRQLRAHAHRVEENRLG